MAGALTLSSWPTTVGFSGASYFNNFLEQMQCGMPGGVPGVLPYSTDQILGAYTNEFKAFGDSTGMQVKVYQGRAYCKGIFAKIADADAGSGYYTLTVTTAHATLYRIDTVIIRFDLTTGSATLRMLDGTAAVVASASPTALTQSATTWDIPLAYVAVDPAVSTISVKDTVDIRVFAPTVAELQRISGFDDPIINGGMDLWQRGTTFASVADGTYTADRWRYGKAGAVVHDAKQTADVPAVAPNAQLDSTCLHLDVTTADASIAAGDFSVIEQRIEGRRAKRVLQRGFTLPFWVKDTIPGWHAISFVNSGGDRSCVCEYFVFAADTWELKFVHVPASPTGGTWDYATGIGARAVFTQAAGTTFQATTPGSWETGLFYGTARTVNSNSSTSNNFKIWGVGRMVPGNLVLPFSPHENDLALALRYFCKTFDLATTPAQNTGSFNGALAYKCHTAGVFSDGAQWRFPVPMRTTPSFVFYSPNAASALWYNASGSAASGAASTLISGQNSTMVTNAQAAADAQTNYLTVHATADAEL